MSTVAARVRAHRARRAAGQRLLTIKCDEIAMVEVLERMGLLAPMRDHEQHEIEAAVERLIELLPHL